MRNFQLDKPQNGLSREDKTQPQKKVQTIILSHSVHWLGKSSITYWTVTDSINQLKELVLYIRKLSNWPDNLIAVKQEELNLFKHTLLDISKVLTPACYIIMDSLDQQ